MNRGRNDNIFSGRARRLLPAVTAAGSVCGFLASPAGAIELGELRMESTLGQPLRASIAYALGPNESLYDFCIALRAPQSGGPIPSVTRARVSVTGNTIVLTGDTVVKDPLLNLRVAIDCPYTPHLVREYTMIIDPVLPETQNTVVAQQPASSAAPAPTSATTPQPSRPAAARPQAAVVLPDIPMNSDYRVRNGDTVSAIAARVEGRTIGVWNAVATLIASNPDAFIDGDANQLVSGSLMFIPDLTVLGPVPGDTSTRRAEPAAAVESTLAEETSAYFAPDPVEEEPVATPSAEPEAQPVVEAPEPIVEAASPPAESREIDTTVDETPAAAVETVVEVAAEPQPVIEPVVESVPEPLPEPVAEPAAEAELQPGDVIVAATAPAVEQPAAPIVRNVSPEPASGSNWSWIVWLAAGGAALILAGGVFWGRLRDMFGSRAVNEPATPLEPLADEETVTSTIIDDVDFEFNDAITTEAMALDADFEAGTGLQDSGEIDVAQEFNFDSVSESNAPVDLEVPKEAAREPDKHETDIIPPSHRAEESSILEAEIEPSDEEYDMSMIVDATKQSMGEDDLTAQDLKAVPAGSGASTDEYAIEDGTLATRMDLEILEKDYEEEFTQTQALNKEIEQAAAELARSMADQEGDASVDFEVEPTAVGSSPAADFDLTAEMPVSADDPGLEPTAEMPSRTTDLHLELTAEMPDSPADPGAEPTVEMSMTEDDSGTHPELTANIPVDAEALNDDLVDPDVTSKLAAAGSDVTVEMEVESGSVDTKNDLDQG